MRDYRVIGQPLESWIHVSDIILDRHSSLMVNNSNSGIRLLVCKSGI